MSGHTRGPWIAASYSSVVGAPVVSQSGRPIASVTYFKLGDGFQNHDRESAANACLIAAAPDLLEALRQIVQQDDTGPMVYETRENGPAQAIGGSEGKFAAIARAAIAKAEGRS